MYKTLSAPIAAQIELSNACINKCVHCYNFWRQEKKNTTKQMRLMPDQIRFILRKLHNSKVFDITATGGEPLLNKKGLRVLLKEARDLEMGVSINTTLSPLNLSDIRGLKKSGMKSVLTSILGPNAKIHDDITQQRGSFDRTVNGIKLAMKENIYVVANMVVTKLNLNYLRETAVFITSLGIKKFIATKAGCPGNCNDFSKFSLDTQQFRDYLKEIYGIAQDLNVGIDALESYPLCGIQDVKISKMLVDRKCLAGVTTFTIATDGSVRPCPHLDVSYGNIFQEEIPTIWNRMQEWRDGSLLPQTCKRCKILSLCGGGCRMEAKMRFGSLSALDPYSAPDNIEIFVHELKKEPKKEDSKNIHTFSLNNFRWRKEYFGGIIVVDRKTRVYLDKVGMEALMQIRKGKIYGIDSKELNWFSIESPIEFLSELARKKVISINPRKEV